MIGRKTPILRFLVFLLPSYSPYVSQPLGVQNCCSASCSASCSRSCSCSRLVLLSKEPLNVVGVWYMSTSWLHKSRRPSWFVDHARRRLRRFCLTEPWYQPPTGCLSSTGPPDHHPTRLAPTAHSATLHIPTSVLTWSASLKFGKFYSGASLRLSFGLFKKIFDCLRQANGIGNCFVSFANLLIVIH